MNPRTKKKTEVGTIRPPTRSTVSYTLTPFVSIQVLADNGFLNLNALKNNNNKNQPSFITTIGEFAYRTSEPVYKMCI